MIGQLCTRAVVTASEDESVLSLARRMAKHDVGTVVVVTKLGQPVGIVTDRDVVKRAVALELSLGTTPVSAIMTRQVTTIDEDAPIEEAFRVMADAATRRLVVIGPSYQVHGVVSLDDLLELLAYESAAVARVVGGARRHAGSSGAPPDTR